MSALEVTGLRKGMITFFFLQNSGNAFTCRKTSDLGIFSFKIQIMSVKKRLLPSWLMLFLPPVDYALMSEPEL